MLSNKYPKFYAKQYPGTHGNNINKTTINYKLLNKIFKNY